MVYLMENPIKMDDLEGKNPYFWVDTHISFSKDGLVFDHPSA